MSYGPRIQICQTIPGINSTNIGDYGTEAMWITDQGEAYLHYTGYQNRYSYILKFSLQFNF